MLHITNKEKKQCNVWVIDYKGFIHYEASLQPNESLQLAPRTWVFGIYRIIFKTESTSYIQEFVKY